MEITGWSLKYPLSPLTEPYPVPVCCVILCAVGDLGLAIIQDVPDDREAGHLLSTAHRVLRLLKGHYPAGCKEAGYWSGGPGLNSFLAPSVPPTQPHTQRNEMRISSERS